MKTRWTHRARQDLSAIGRYIARDDVTAARRWVARLKARGELVAEQPLAGRRVPEMAREDIREVILGNYRIVYLVNDTSVDILTVFEGHRLLPPDVLPESDP